MEDWRRVREIPKWSRLSDAGVPPYFLNGYRNWLSKRARGTEGLWFPHGKRDVQTDGFNKESRSKKGAVENIVRDQDVWWRKKDEDANKWEGDHDSDTQSLYDKDVKKAEGMV